jgi:hypothetical protein
LDDLYIGEPNSGCWLWLGAVDQDNYGMAWDHPLQRTARAHRVVYESLVSRIPEGMKLLHRCDNTYCVNPDHMFVGTIADNNADMRAKKRHGHGETHGMNKLSAEQIREIRTAPGKHRDIAAKYGVTRGWITNIKARRAWKHLEA